MKKILLIGFVLLLSGCSFDSKLDGKTAEEWKNKYEEISKKVDLLESNEKLFEKKKQCQKDGMIYQKNLYEKDNVDSIFNYSKLNNSCLFYVSELLGSGGWLRQITDIYSNKVLFSNYSNSNGDYFLDFGGITRNQFDIEAEKLGF